LKRMLVRIDCIIQKEVAYVKRREKDYMMTSL